MTITVDGAAVTGIAGQSIAGILMAGDQLELRRTARHDRPRGVFCGIGVCFDCLVTIDGVGNRQGCLVPVAEGMQIEIQMGTSLYGPTIDQAGGTYKNPRVQKAMQELWLEQPPIALALAWRIKELPFSCGSTG